MRLLDVTGWLIAARILDHPGVLRMIRRYLVVIGSQQSKPLSNDKGRFERDSRGMWTFNKFNVLYIEWLFGQF